MATRFKANSTDAKASRCLMRIGVIDDKLIELGERRQAFVLPAVDNERPAQIAIAKIDDEITSLKAERATLTSAVAQLEQLARAEETKAKQAEQDRRQADAARLSTTIADINGKIDTGMAELATLFRQRHKLPNELRQRRG